MVETAVVEPRVGPKVIRDYVFCPENGVSVGMEYTKLNLTGAPIPKVEIKLAVTFCQEYVTLSKKEARTRLNERLEDAIFKDGYCSNKYTCKVLYGGTSAKKDLLLPFLRYITNLLSSFKTVKPLLKSASFQDENRVKFYINYVTTFGLLQEKSAHLDSIGFGLGLEEAQNLSVCETAKIHIRGHKEVVWVKGQEGPLTKVSTSQADKKLVFKPLHTKVAIRLKKMTGWEPVFRKEDPKPVELSK